MAKKKREHVVFDQMLRIRKSIPISKVNFESGRKKVRKEGVRKK